MKKILSILLLFISVAAISQPSNYLNIRSRYNLIAVKTDSGFHVPCYSTIPNYRGGVWSGAGNIGVDTVNNKFYFYSGGAWREAGSTNYADSLRRSGLNVQMRKNGNWTTQYTDSIGSGITQEQLDDSTAAIRADFPTGGGADSSVFATLYRVDTAKTNLRTSIATKVSGSGTNLQLALWNGSSTVTGMPQYTFSGNTTYPGLTIGASGGVSSSLSLRDAAGTYMALSSDGGYFGIYGSSTYKNVQIYSHAGGTLMAQFYRPTTYNIINLNGLVRSNDLTVLSNYEGNFHIPRTVPYLVSGNNYHGFTDGTDFRQGSSAFNSFGSFVKFGNNQANQDHYAAFQNVWTKDSSNTMSKVYGFVNAVSAMKAGRITDLYGYYHYSPTVTGGTIDNHYGIYIPAVTGATKNVGAYIESNVGIGTSSPNSKLEVSGSLATKYTATATGITLDATHCVVNVTATGQTITLPAASGITGRQYTIKLTASGSCTIDGNASETIDGATTYSLASQYKYVTIVSDGSNWIITANN